MPDAVLIDADTMEELRRDALRYRWLRGNDCALCVSVQYEAVEIRMNGNELDDAIDRQMSSEPDDEQHDPVHIESGTGEYDEEGALHDRARAKDFNAG